ncbi:GDSL-type esterase/lipase family protein [Ruminococcus sp.]|uniref:GDSL-type esterase/lipase family protein n=1 Tax=Ruminococcus sp. TaxID=41978 RepID=UPI0025F64B34|nr:GDSL-type esterase/lipase family protein [Ruminococcus sp.]MBQ8967335.1 SGNH/GDSL hydrolase family protein [Ruminococcus sp.]
MEHSNSAIRKRRVKAQQNMVTTLCLACMVFTVGWSVFAAVREAKDHAKAAVAEGKVSASSSRTDKSSSAAEESSREDSSEEAAATDSFEPYYSEDEHPYATAKDTADDLSDAVFIGDSRTVGMMNSTDKPQATFICAVGLNIDTVLTSGDIVQGDGSVGTLQQALSGKDFGRVYISFGTNEMGWPYIDVFEEHYTEMVKTIQSYQPNAEIYLIGILPLAESQDYDGDAVNNENARTFTASIEKVADQLGVHYLDCSEAVADENGYLPEEASPDGIHMTADYCLYWQNYIIDNT